MLVCIEYGGMALVYVKLMVCTSDMHSTFTNDLHACTHQCGVSWNVVDSARFSPAF
jgi:hypothetical protein